jgi:hypothetical protein
MMPAVLYARRTSVYKSLRADVYDEDRDARTYHRSAPVVAHPPCTLWCRLRGLARRPESEKALAFHALSVVRRTGGVLEHPAHSQFWKAADLPRSGAGKDEFGGWTLPVDQRWWGHRAQKPTWLYIVGVEPSDLPTIPFVLGKSNVWCVDNAKNLRAHAFIETMGRAEREATPPQFATWLLEVARCAA